MSQPQTNTTSDPHDRIVWIDCEMTGLDPRQHTLVEIAVHITDAQLNVLDDGLDLVIHATDSQLAAMDDYVTQMHASSGLTEEIKASSITIKEAEQQVLNHIRSFVAEPRTAPLAGNSIASDRAFLKEYMPELDAFLHYRMLDVSTLKELSRRWYPEVYSHQPEKGMSHRALADIKESIRELVYYRQAMMLPAESITKESVRQAADEASTLVPISHS